MPVTVPDDGRFAGMTVNERLFAAGLLSAWDNAVESADRGAMLSLLRQVRLTEAQAAWTTDEILSRRHSH